jgi:hypothetical protein
MPSWQLTAHSDLLHASNGRRVAGDEEMQSKRAMGHATPPHHYMVAVGSKVVVARAW